MFKDFIRVDIELFSYCNRSCAWCPNHYASRPYTELSDEVFLSILHSLKTNNFEDRITYKDQKSISLNGYSEPLSRPDILIKRIGQLRDILPGVEIVVNTNGDYLTKELLSKLVLSNLSIMDYDCRGSEYWKAKFKEFDILLIASEKDRLVGTHRNINHIICKIDWPLNYEIENRAGFLPRQIKSGEIVCKWKNGRQRRSTICTDPLYFPAINSDGSVMMCCHTRCDTHGQHILGNVNTQDLKTIFESEKYLRLIEPFQKGDVANYPKECQYCQKERCLEFDGLDRHILRDKYKSIGNNKNLLAAKNIHRTDYGGKLDV